MEKESHEFTLNSSCTCVRQPAWGKFNVKIAGERSSVIGRWPYPPTSLLKGFKFKGVLEKQVNGYKLVKCAEPVSWSACAAAHHMMAKGILREELQKLSDANDGELVPALDCLEGDDSELLNAYSAVRKLISLKTRFPGIPDDALSEMDVSSLANVEEAPYTLLDLMPSTSLTLQIADEMAREKKMTGNSMERVAAYFKCAVHRMHAKQGDYWFEIPVVIKTVLEDIGAAKWQAHVSMGRVLEAMTPLVHKEGNSITLRWMYNEECEAATLFTRLLKGGRERFTHFASNPEPTDEEMERLDDAQKEAVCCVAQNGSIVLLGGAGTGKTSTVKEICSMLCRAGVSLRLCAPTGKAASVLTERTGVSATTVHFEAAQGRAEAGIVYIIDECSMLSVRTFLLLLRNIADSAIGIIMVGDVNQLPSVEPGALLQDIVGSGIIPTITLRTIHRQGSGSVIAQNAHAILQGLAGDWDATEELEDANGWFLRFPRDIMGESVRQTLQLCARGKKTQLLVQTNQPRDDANRVIQATLNPPNVNKPEISRGSAIAPWRVGDRVMNLENRYEEGKMVLSNGEIGTISNIIDKTLSVSFRAKTLHLTSTVGLDHAYAVTVHKFQGSEEDAIVFAMNSNFKEIQSKQALYTAVTRARSAIYICSRPPVWYIACTRDQTNRKTKLSELLIARINEMQCAPSPKRARVNK